MATTKKTKAKKSAERKSAPKKARGAKGAAETMSAIDLLEEDHREVEGYFDQYEELEDESEKEELATKICLALRVHTQIEEEIFYPAARKATEDDDLLDEAKVEHQGATRLIEEIEEMMVGDDLYDAKVKVLGEQVKHHVKEEEEELFPEVKSAKMDVEALGKKMAARKQELMSELGDAEPGEVEADEAEPEEERDGIDRAAAGSKPGGGAKSRGKS
jgi:hemerythrin HHE cation binding domain-containing protein